jgi:hypothetical protein
LKDQPIRKFYIYKISPNIGLLAAAGFGKGNRNVLIRYLTQQRGGTLREH